MGGVAQVVEHLPDKQEAEFKFHTPKKKKKEKKKIKPKTSLCSGFMFTVDSLVSNLTKISKSRKL
jgi:hypothetical protein